MLLSLDTFAVPMEIWKPPSLPKHTLRGGQNYTSTLSLDYFLIMITTHKTFMELVEEGGTIHS